MVNSIVCQPLEVLATILDLPKFVGPVLYKARRCPTVEEVSNVLHQHLCVCITAHWRHVALRLSDVSKTAEAAWR